MLCGAGVAFGAIAAWAFNVWLGDCHGVPTMPCWLIAASAILILGQVSASFPSTRAARVDPAKAIRACRAGPWRCRVSRALNALSAGAG
jgi:ABC-type antimicrobial peptide transport system permease subunit